ncbi:class F sortase [Corynebacterium lowii]|uniref:Sortase family protein n=1 Tax=Corynebacterium lowii TaxID=1544413 RepID=A0A0N8W0P4_9CORY|nr:class F sortase [Corynebacterium lowii]KQB87266.1 Sortase family protein [Corynebacterium lowii]MDP9852147.1 sortase (surface protein transpeptidase) [Corynebacterium lowii]
MSNTNNVPSSRSPQESGGSTQKKNWPAVLIGIVIFVVIVIAAVWALVFAGNNDDSDTAAESSTSTSAYIDDSGEQEHEMEAAPGESDDVSAMQITVGDEGSAEIDAVQVTETENGEYSLVPPQDVQRLGWYSASAVPGAKGNVGSSVITGHVNFAGQGEGYAAKFTHLKKDETFTITVNGEDREFRVTEAPYHVTKGADFPDVIDDQDGENRVVLVTCGGDFVGGQLGYADNIITVAEPV